MLVSVQEKFQGRFQFKISGRDKTPVQMTSLFFYTHIYTHLNFRDVPKITVSLTNLLICSLLKSKFTCSAIAAHFPRSCTGKNTSLSTSAPSVLMCKFTVYITKQKQRYQQTISLHNAMRNNSNAKTTSFLQQQATSKSAVSTNWQLSGISTSLDY